MKERQSTDLAIILIWPIIAAILSLIFEPNAFGSIILFLAIPSIYLAIKGREYVKKALLFTLAVGITTMIILDYVAQKTGAWVMYPDSIINFKLFGIVTFEVVLWAVFTCFFIIIFYEYFINKHSTRIFWQSKMKYVLMLAIISFIIFLVFLFAIPDLLNIPYFYLTWGIVLLLIPFLIQLFRYPKTTSKFFLAGAYFFYLHFIYEITALKLGWWTFPGTEFIGQISMLGVIFPIEELIFWFILLALTTLSYYEFFDDDEK